MKPKASGIATIKIASQIMDNKNHNVCRGSRSDSLESSGHRWRELFERRSGASRNSLMRFGHRTSAENAWVNSASPANWPHDGNAAAVAIDVLAINGRGRRSSLGLMRRGGP